MTAWLDGALTEDPRIDPADRGFTLGDGLFETLRLSGSRPRRLDRHLLRLRQGASLLGMPVPWDDGRLARGMAELAEATGIGDGVLRLTLSRGPGPRGLLPPAEQHPTTLMTLGPLPPPSGPARAVVSAVTRRNEHSPLARIKSLSYLDGVLARLESARKGADDAVLLNTAGRVAEARAANLFIVAGGRPVTPPVGEGALPGTLRAVLIERRQAAERPLGIADLAEADEAFLTSSLGIRPLVALDGRDIAGGLPGPVTRALMAEVDGGGL
ncbi:MAG TPA: aminotransferase class IV [Arenibaculum sp.]|nr:aminotransferase class IV [Arenibaculum sp.]